MKLLCITDLHGNHEALQRILHASGDADLVLLGGDITNFSTPNAAESIVRAIRDRVPRVLAVAGNCDSAEIDKRLVELEVSVFGRGVTIDGIGFYGVPAMPPWTGSMYELTEEQIAEALKRGHGELMNPSRQVLLTHTPPRDTLDRTSRGQHVGSTSVRDCIEQHKPDLVVCGHIHEARGIERIGESLIVNCGPAYRGDYAVAKVADGGVDVKLQSVK